MSDYSIHKMLIGMAIGILLSTTAVTSVLTANDKTEPILDSQGKIQNEYFEECVEIPQTHTYLTNREFKECDDFIDKNQDGIYDENIDNDKDGVSDYRDNCPENTPLEISKGVDFGGCPLDSDQDEVFEYKDRCPDTLFGRAVDEQGCPIVITELPQPIQTDILFAFDSAVLKPDGQSLLNEVLKKTIHKAGGSEFIKNIQIVGHTDSTGTKEYNQQLSDNRAQSVANYLMEQGVSPNKITSWGEGELNPATSNDTKEGRAQNRRVVITITWFKSR